MLNRALIALTSALLLLTAALAFAQDGNAEVTGTVAYRERIALPPDAVINVQLLDTSIADIAAQTVADVMINGEGRQVPVPFTLTCDPAKIVPGNRYSVRATIRSGDGMLMFSTTQSYPVLTHGAPRKVNLILYRVGHGAKPGVAPKKPAPTAPAEPTAAQAAPSAKPAEPQSTSEAVSAPVAAAGGQEPDKDTLGVASQQVVVEPAAAPNTELTLPGAAPQSNDAAPPPAPATQESSSRSPVTESTPTLNETAANTPPGTKQEAPPAEAPATAAPEAATTRPRSKSTETPAVAAEQLPPAETAPAASAPEAKPSEPEAALPEAPSASKGMESAMPPAAETSGSGAAEPVSPAERAIPASALTPLANTQWKLIQLNGQDVVIASTQKPVTLAFSPEGRRIAGSAGCNSFLGTYSEQRGALQMHPGNMTMMFCPDPAGSREKKFIAMLRLVDGYKLNGDFLTLTSNGKIVAKFKTNPPL
jgi:putative lipoprotein